MEKMSSDLKRKQNKKKKINPKPVQLNPNWSLLQQKLKSDSHGNKGNARKLSNNGTLENPNSVLGNLQGSGRRDPMRRWIFLKFNPLNPVNDDSSLTDEVGMDYEMIGVSQGTKSALGRVTLVYKWGNVLYDEFVRPVECVVDFRTPISGIRPRDLENDPSSGVDKGKDFSSDMPCITISRDKTRKSQKHLASEFLWADIQNGEHCPIDDARAAMMLYQKNKSGTKE